MHTRIWREISLLQVKELREHVETTLPTAIDELADTRLNLALTAAAANGTMPSFQDPGARAGYTVRHLCTRSLKFADCLLLDETPWVQSALHRMFFSGVQDKGRGSGGSRCLVMSLGGVCVWVLTR